MKKVIRLTESDLMRIVKRVINEDEGRPDPYKADLDPVKYLSNALRYKVDGSLRKETGYTTIYNGSEPDRSTITISVYHPLDARKDYFIEVYKNKMTKKFTGRFGKQLFDSVINYIKTTTESDLTRIVKRFINEQGSKLDLGVIKSIFKNKGYSIENTPGYKLHGHKETTGPIKNPKTGEFLWNYEMYVPVKGASDEGVPGTQLWVDRRRETANGGTESENIIIGLDGNNHVVKKKKNGNQISKTTLSTDSVITLLNNYSARF